MYTQIKACPWLLHSFPNCRHLFCKSVFCLILDTGKGKRAFPTWGLCSVPSPLSCFPSGRRPEFRTPCVSRWKIICLFCLETEDWMTAHRFCIISEGKPFQATWGCSQETSDTFLGEDSSHRIPVCPLQTEAWGHLTSKQNPYSLHSGNQLLPSSALFLILSLLVEFC